MEDKASDKDEVSEGENSSSDIEEEVSPAEHINSLFQSVREGQNVLSEL